MKNEDIPIVYQLKISLNNIKPLIWRRIQVSENISLKELHHIIQVLFGWNNSHLHKFEYDGNVFGYPDEEDSLDVNDDRDFLVYDLMVNKGDTLDYMYDFGDCWELKIVLERIIKNDKLVQNPICIDGFNNAPLEDCGGAGGFQNMLKEYKKSGSVRYQELISGKVIKYDPKLFDLVKVNKGSNGKVVGKRENLDICMHKKDIYANENRSHSMFIKINITRRTI